MENMYGCCGLNCLTCGAYIATQNNDDAMREKVAKEWSEKHGGTFTADQINCDGCQVTDGRAPDWTNSMCPIRKCAHGKLLGTCAECDDFMCEQLAKFTDTVPAMRENLDRLRK